MALVADEQLTAQLEVLNHYNNNNNKLRVSIKTLCVIAAIASR
jgi:hypothetical protein